MHVMTKYIDTYKAAIAALEDYCAMQQIIDTTDQQIKDAYNAVTSVSSARLDGMPHAPNPRGGEDRIAATLDKVDAYRARYAHARVHGLVLARMGRPVRGRPVGTRHVLPRRRRR